VTVTLLFKYTAGFGGIQLQFVSLKHFNRFAHLLLPIDEMISSRGLTLRAEEHIMSTNFRSAVGARLLFAVTNLHVGADFDVNWLRGSFNFFYSPCHDGKNGVVELVVFFAREFPYEGLRMNLRVEQDFIRIRVADRTEYRVVVDEDADLLAGV
jgi:hypothetical protein